MKRSAMFELQQPLVRATLALLLSVLANASVCPLPADDGEYIPTQPSRRLRLDLVNH